MSAFVEGAKENGHEVMVVPVCQKKIAGCLACEYCHTKGEGRCIQQDDMQEVYPVLAEAEMIVLASPVDSRNRCANPVIRFTAQRTHLLSIIAPQFRISYIPGTASRTLSLDLRRFAPFIQNCCAILDKLYYKICEGISQYGLIMRSA